MPRRTDTTDQRVRAFLERWGWALSRSDRHLLTQDLERLLATTQQDGRRSGWERAIDRVRRLLDENEEG